MVNWALAGGNGFQNALAQGMQMGQQLKQQREEKQFGNALNSLVANPGQDDAQFAEIVKGLPGQQGYKLMQMRQQYQQGQAEQQRTAQDRHREQLPVVGKLLTYAKQGPQQWAEALAQAHQMGLDVSNVPPQYDPQWADQQIGFIQVLSTPEGQQALSAAGKNAVDMGYKPGTPEFAQVVQQIWTAGESKPYVVGGETRLYSPQIGGQGQAQGIPKLTDPSQVSQLKPGEQFYDPSGVLRMVPQGGPTQPASGSFLGQ